MTKDISTRADIVLLVDRFYQKVRRDDLIGRFFEEVNWETHLPLMYNFWETTLWGTRSYKGNPIQAHKTVHDKSPLEKPHFEQWLYLFRLTVDENFKGPQAERIKTRAQSIATVMDLRLNHAFYL